MNPSCSIIPIAHLSCHLRTLGGMQSVLQHHLTHDENSDLQSRQICFFEQNDPAPDKVDALGWNGLWTICQMRRAANRAFQRHPIGIAVYHNCWGVPFLADLDGATRRLSYLHGIPPDMEACLQAQNGLLDGIIAISQSQINLAARCLPNLSPERLCLVQLPIAPKCVDFSHSSLKKRSITIGYSGRLVKAIKRVDRLPVLVQCLSDANVDFRLEILGSGPDGPWLKKQLEGNQKVIFHGAKCGEDYWKILGHWDLQINLSDSEGFSISILEGLSCGVIPIFPRIESGGADYTQRVNPDLIYPLGNLKAAAQSIQHLIQMSDAELDSLRVKCRQAVQAHTPDAYQKTFRSFIAGIDALPRISQDAFGHRPFHLTDHLPLGILSRMLPTSLFKR